MAVFLGSGKKGFDGVVEEKAISKEAQDLLAEQYVAVHVDTGTKAGKELAEQLRLPKGLGLVISSRDGTLQAFRHAGTLGAKDLTSYLKRYSSAEYRVVTTENAESARTSFYAGPKGEGKDDDDDDDDDDDKEKKGKKKAACKSSSSGCATSCCTTSRGRSSRRCGSSSGCSSGGCSSSRWGGRRGRRCR